MDQKFIDLYDEFTHSTMDRRLFLDRLAKLAGSAAAAALILKALEVRPAQAGLVAPEDERIDAGAVTFPGATGEMRGYLARPADGGPYPGLVVIHENRGLNAHIEDVARRAAVAGFTALAPDALSPMGGTPADSDEARAMIGRLDYGETVRNFVAAVAFLDGHEATTGKVGCVGFCWGGGMSNQLAVHADALDAAVVFYGRPPDTSDVPRINVPLLLNYAGLDTRLNSLLPDFRAALDAASVRYLFYMYEGAQHAFHNDTAPTRYDKASAETAWARTLAFLEEHLA